MSDLNRISLPNGMQSPSVVDWSKSLRSRSPSPVRQSLTSKARSPSPSGKRPIRSRSRSPSVKENVNSLSNKITSSLSVSGPFFSDVPTKSLSRKLDMNNSLRKSSPNLAANLSSPTLKTKKSTNKIASIESEYIKNLQQQIYFLELEANYLREQARKATDIQPQMTAEAERMLTKLRQMQMEMDGMNMEMRRKESALEITESAKEKIQKKLNIEEQSREQEKRFLMEDVLHLKKENGRMELEMDRRDAQLLEAKNELDKSSTALKNAELSILTLRSQLDQRVEQHNLTQLALEEKRTDLLTKERQLKELEDKYYNSQVMDKISDDLREEIRMLQQKLKESELNARQEQHLRDETSHILKENAYLHQQVIEQQKQLEREKDLRETNEARHNRHIAELVTLKDKQKDLQFDLDHTKELLNKEQYKSKHSMELLASQDSMKTSTELQLNTLRSRISEVEGEQRSRDLEVNQLRKDKMQLVDHVSDLHKKLADKQEEIDSLKSYLDNMEGRLNDTEKMKTLESTMNSQKWEEFGRLAESMRDLSHTMSNTSARASSMALKY